MAFDLRTGKEVWSWGADGPSYASPIVVDLGGTRQVVTQSQQNLIGVSVADGKLLWSLPFKNAWEQNIPTPIIYDETLIFSGLDKGVTAIRLRQVSGRWAAEKVWENGEVSFYMSTPVLNGNLLFGLGETLRTVHEYLNRTLIVVALGHVAAALKHQFIDRDGLLRRMWPGRTVATDTSLTEHRS